jgi:hypothetical protein
MATLLWLKGIPRDYLAAGKSVAAIVAPISASVKRVKAGKPVEGQRLTAEAL